MFKSPQNQSISSLNPVVKFSEVDFSIDLNDEQNITQIKPQLVDD